MSTRQNEVIKSLLVKNLKFEVATTISSSFHSVDLPNQARGKERDKVVPKL